MLNQPSAPISDATATQLGSLTSTLQGHASTLITTSQSYIDRWVPPSKRESIKDQLTQFANSRPILMAFILSQLALSGLPLALFLITIVTISLFALLAGLLVGLIGALLFIGFSVGLGLCLLLPTLFFTTLAAVFFFFWGLAGYYIVKWFNQESAPVVHEPLKEGIQKMMGLEKVSALSGEARSTPTKATTTTPEAVPISASSELLPQKIERINERKESHPLQKFTPEISRQNPNSAPAPGIGIAPDPSTASGGD